MTERPSPPAPLTLQVNGRKHQVDADGDTPLLTILRHELGLKGPKYGCGEEQCGACKVLIDGQAVPSCRLPVKNVVGLAVVTVEGLGTADALHPLQEAFVAAQAIQCGYCAAGMIMAAQGLLNQVRYPTDDQIGAALADNLCRCGVYDRVRRAIRLRVGRDVPPAYEIIEPLPVPAPDSAAELPRSIQQTPALDAWIRIDAGGTITLFSGKVEYGQGISTALIQIGAAELDVDPARVRLVLGDTDRTPDEGLTVGSMSLETSGQALRWAAAEARGRLLAVAFEALEAPPERLVVEDGVIRDPDSGRRATYWELQGGRPFGGTVTGRFPPKPLSSSGVIGQALTRVDLVEKVCGAPVFVHDLTLPNMAFGRVVRPPHPEARLGRLDAGAVERLPGVLAVVRDGSFLGVVASSGEVAAAAQAALAAAAVWHDVPLLPEGELLYEELFGQPAQAATVVAGAVIDEAAPVLPRLAPPAAVQTVRAGYFRPYQMHAALGPSAAAALWETERLTIWAHTQGAFPQRAAIAHVLGLPEARVRVIQRDGSGCYGHNGSDDAALEAALLARAVPNRPVLLQWTRADENAREPYAPAMRVELEAALGPAGEILAWNHDLWSPSHSGRPRVGPGISGFLAARALERPLAPPTPRLAVWTHSGSHRNADPLYAVAPRRIVKHFLPRTPLRVSSLRSLGAFANLFAIESFMDELAHAAGEDPLAFRRRHLDDSRALAVLDAAAEKAGWTPGSRIGDQPAGRGRGLALARYKNRQTCAAVIVDLRVDAASGVIQLERAIIAADAGCIVNPDGLSNQLEGGFVQAASMTLKEEVTWNASGIASLDWDSYPILRFPDAPVIETVLLNRPAQPWMGAGEATAGPTPAAIANAIFDATGVRLRRLPFTPARVRAALGVERDIQ